MVRVGYMGKFNSWTNINNDGRRLEKIIKLCETMIAKKLEEGNIPDKITDHDIILAYIDRLIKAETMKVKVVDLVLGISHIRKVAEKKLEQPKMYLHG